MLPMPTIGAYLSLVHVPRPLRVVGVVLRPRADLGVVAPPSVIVFTEYEAAASLEGAKAHGWELVPGLPAGGAMIWRRSLAVQTARSSA